MCFFFSDATAAILVLRKKAAPLKYPRGALALVPVKLKGSLPSETLKVRNLH